MTKQINQIWNFFKKAVVKWKYLKNKNKFRVCVEGTKKEFKENFNYEFKEEEMHPEPPKPPKWFTNWTQDFEKRIDKRFDRVDARLDKIENDVHHLKKDMEIVKSVPIIKEAFKKQK